MTLTVRSMKLVARTDVFYFDGDCGFCERCAQLLRLLVDAHLSVLPAYHQDAGLPVEVVSEIETHAVAELGGEFFYGHEAIGQSLRVRGKFSVIRLIGNLLCIKTLARFWGWVYQIVARNRHQLNRLVGAQVCRVR